LRSGCSRNSSLSSGGTRCLPGCAFYDPLGRFQENCAHGHAESGDHPAAGLLIDLKGVGETLLACHFRNHDDVLCAEVGIVHAHGGDPAVMNLRVAGDDLFDVLRIDVLPADDEKIFLLPDHVIQGESGRGKDLIAKAVHYESVRAEKPFVAINCSAIPETLMEAELFGHERGAFTDAKQMKKGLFEAADGGTLFLDEIGELSPLLQAKLLRVLEDQVIRRVGGVRDMQVDVRVIAASNRDLEKAVRENQFRQDLYYRLAMIAIFIPPLRDRKQDLLPLVDFFIDRYNRQFKKSVRGISDDTRKLLLTHTWPGNVRELKNTIERAMILEEEQFLRPVYLPFSVSETGGRTVFERTAAPENGQTLANGRMLPRLYIPEGGTSLEEVERAMVELAMRQANSNQTQAAKLLNISRDALRYKLKKFGLMHGEEEEGASQSSPDTSSAR